MPMIVTNVGIRDINYRSVHACQIMTTLLLCYIHDVTYTQ